MLVSLTVGKVDAGVAVLLTEDKRLIEFPSILLPPSISSGSIVDITVSCNTNSEAHARKNFQALQNSILTTFGQHSPSPPRLRCRNATQTSIVLEWDPIDLATADLRSLSLYRNGNKAGNIPRPLEITSTKISGLAVDTEYVFHLVLRTSAGQYTSEKLTVRTHKMTDLSGITVTPGVLPAPIRESLSSAVQRIGAKLADTVRIDTTHFVCIEGRGREWEKAVESNIPVVRPEWLQGCEREGRIVGVRGYYLNADPRLRQVGPGISQPQQTTAYLQQQRDHTESQSNLHQQQQHQQRVIPASQPSASNTPKQASEQKLQSSPPRTPISEPFTPPPLPAKDTPIPLHASAISVSEGSSENLPNSPPAHYTRVLSPRQVPKTEVEENAESVKTPADEGNFTEVQL